MSRTGSTVPSVNSKQCVCVGVGDRDADIDKKLYFRSDISFDGLPTI